MKQFEISITDETKLKLDELGVELETQSYDETINKIFEVLEVK